MTLVEIRQWLLEVTGRNDLMYTDFSGRPGIDKYIRAGQRYLDGRYSAPRTSGVVEVELLPDVFSVDVSGLRAIKDVWIDGEDRPLYLRKLSLEGLHGLFRNVDDLSEVASGTPVDYAIGVRNVDEDPPSIGKKRLLLFPPNDTLRTLYVYGLLWSDELSSDDSTSFWSSVMPHTLVEAAWMMIERSYRNQEGVRDHLLAIEDDIRQVDFDVVEEDIAQQYQMRSSW